MPAPTCLAEAWADRATETRVPATLADATRDQRRAFYAGALAALTLLGDGRPREAIFAELVAHGRSIGTAAETA